MTISHDLALPDRAWDQVRPKIERLVAKLAMPFPVYVFPAEQLDAVVEHFDIPGPIPFTLALDAQGQIVDTQEGVASLERFRAMIGKALAN